MYELIPMEIMLERMQRKTAGGIILHYIKHDDFISLLNGRQLMLTRYDKMNMGCHEAKKIFEQLKDILDNNIIQNGAEIANILREKVDRINSSHLIPHRFHYSDKPCDTIPYVICFTMEDEIGGGDSELVRMMTYRDLFIEFHANYMELECFEKINGQGYRDTWKVIDIVRMDYESECLKQEFTETVIGIAGRYDPESASEKILEYACNRALSILPSGYSDEKECRLIYYMPAEKGKYPEAERYADKKRCLDNDGQLIEIDEEDQDHIYLNFSDSKKYMTIVINPDSEYSIEHYRDVISKAGFEPIVFDPRWPKA